MAITAEQFGRAVVGSGVLSAEELKAFWATIPAAERPADGPGFARKLFEAGKLTEYQAKQILANRGHTLVMGDYVVLAEIGAGGMGQVYKAQHRRMNRTVALKVMSPAAMKDEAAVQRFQREVRAAARLDHPNIVTAYDSGEAGNVKYLVMQFVDGEDLATLVKRDGPLEVGKAVDYMVQAARGLAFAHGEGVIHRDIKPANLLIERKKVVKILDMGLARIESADDGLTATEQVMGTVDYMSPEQATNTKTADARSDVYSLGCTLWFLLTGKKLYEADTMIARLMAHREAPLPSLVQLRDDAPWPLEQALHRMVAKHPQDRFQSMDDVIAALETYSSGSSPGGGSSLGGASKPHAPEFAAFLQGIGSGASTRSSTSTTGVATRTSKTAADDATQAFQSPVAVGNRNALLAAGGATFLIVGAACFFLLRSSSDKAPDATTVTPAAAALAPTSSVPEVAGPATAASASSVVNMLESNAYVWSPAENLGAPLNSDRSQQWPTLTEDELRLVCMSQPTGSGLSELVEASRASLSSPWQEPVRLSGAVGEREPSLSADGLLLAYCASTGSLGKNDIWLRRRASRDAPWSNPENLGPSVNGPSDDRYPCLSADGLSLIFASDRPRNTGHTDFWIARRASRDVPFGRAETYDPRLDTTSYESNPQWLADGKTLRFARGDTHYLTFKAASGITGATRLEGTPPGAAWLSPDGKRWYFSSMRPGGLGNSDLWMTRRVTPEEAAKLQDRRPVDSPPAEPQGGFFMNPSTNSSPVPPGDYALAFNGFSARVTVPSWKYRGEHPLTVECWIVWKRAEQGGTNSTVCGDPDGAGFSLWENASGKTEGGLGRWNFGVNDGRYRNASMSEQLPRGRPVHLAGVFDGDENVRFYVNGKLQGRTKLEKSYIPSTVPFTIGANAHANDAFSEYFRGVIDELRISKIARYVEDFTPATRFSTDGDAIAIYHFDDGTGGRLSDATGNGHHGEIVNCPWVPGIDSAYIKRPPNPKPELPAGWTAYDVLTSDEWTWSPAENLGPVVNYSIPDMGPSLSADGLTMIFSSPRYGGYGGRDLHIAYRSTPEEPWSSPVAMGPPANSPGEEIYAVISNDRKSLHVLRGEPNGQGSIWSLRRDDPLDAWDAPQLVAQDARERYGRFAISEDGLTALVGFQPADGKNAQDIVRCTRKSLTAPWEFGDFEPGVNSPADENPLSLIDGGRVLLFASKRPLEGRPAGSLNLYLCTRKAASDAWTAPVALPPEINRGGSVVVGALRFDGCELVFSSADLGGDDILVARRVKK